MNKRLNIDIGEHYGGLTVLASAPKDETGHIKYLVRCDCGKEYYLSPGPITRQKYGCRECGIKLRQIDDRKRHVGQTINGWKILRMHGMDISQPQLYECKCPVCGTVSLQNYSELINLKGKGCQYCAPDYKFKIMEKTAEGQLNDGTRFLIDADDIPLVNAYHWKVSGKGYLEALIFHTSGCESLLMHRLICHVAEEVYVDHINRNKLDCRRQNLRLATPSQNSFNRSIKNVSISGYRGVTKIANAGRYQARIGFDNRMVHLGVTDNPIEAAQLYNEAALLLYGEYVGELNDVPEASVQTKKRAYSRCSKYFPKAMELTRPVLLQRPYQEAV